MEQNDLDSECARQVEPAGPSSHGCGAQEGKEPAGRGSPGCCVDPPSHGGHGFFSFGRLVLVRKVASRAPEPCSYPRLVSPGDAMRVGGEGGV